MGWFGMYDKLQTLEVNSGTLKSISRFGSFAHSGITTAQLTNSTIDLVSSLGEQNLQMPPGVTNSAYQCGRP